MILAVELLLCFRCVALLYCWKKCNEAKNHSKSFIIHCSIKFQCTRVRRNRRCH